MRFRHLIIVAAAIACTQFAAPVTHAQTPLTPSTCFKQEECGVGKYKNSFPVSSTDCAPFNPFSYNCISSPPAVKLNIPIAGNTEIAGLQKYIVVIYKFLIGAAGILAGIMITIAGFEWLTAAGDSGKIKHARERIMKALLGLVLTLGSYTILYTINPALISLQLVPVKIHRSSEIEYSSIYKNCNQDIDCNPFYVNYTRCSLATGGSSTGLLVNRVCEHTTPPPSPDFKGKCKIAQGGICKISDYICGSVTNLVTFGLLGSPDSAGSDMSGFCQKGNSCQPNGEFKPADADLGSPAHQSTCKPTSMGSICKTDNDCPANAICKLALGSTDLERVDQEQVGTCQARVTQAKPEGEACTDDRDCASGKCQVTGGTITLNPDHQSTTTITRGQCLPTGGNPINGNCNRNIECSSNLCADNKCQATDRTAQNETRIREGGLCENTSQCYPGLNCSCSDWDNFDNCTKKQCYPIKGQFYPCENDSQCGRGNGDLVCSFLAHSTCQYP